MSRLLLVPDGRLLELRPLVQAHSREVASSLGKDGFGEVFDSTLCGVLTEDLKRVGADEGTVWLLDDAREYLVPRFNSGPRAADFVGQFQQSLRSGMISMVVATELPICENEVHLNQQRDPALDQRLGLTTCAMIAVPFYYAGELRGVISGVRLCAGEVGPTESCGFSLEDLNTLQRTATVLSRLIDHRLLTLCLGTCA